MYYCKVSVAQDFRYSWAGSSGGSLIGLESRCRWDISFTSGVTGKGFASKLIWWLREFRPLQAARLSVSVCWFFWFCFVLFSRSPIFQYDYFKESQLMPKIHGEQNKKIFNKNKISEYYAKPHWRLRQKEKCAPQYSCLHVCLVFNYNQGYGRILSTHMIFPEHQSS